LLKRVVRNSRITRIAGRRHGDDPVQAVVVAALGEQGEGRAALWRLIGGGTF